MKKINNIFFKLTAPLRNKKEKGFTLIEIMVALALFGSFFGIISTLVVSTMSARKTAGDLTRAVFLARQTMNGIKARREIVSKQGEFESFKGYKYKYEIKEIEMDLNKLAEASDGAVEIDDDQLALMKKKGQSRETETGAIFKMLQYQVWIYYGQDFKKEYNLQYFRGLGVF